MERDIFVGGVAVALGIYIIVMAVTNAQHHFRMYSSQLLVKALGEQKARIVLVLLGSVVLAIGIFIIWKKPATGSNRQEPNGSDSRQAFFVEHHAYLHHSLSIICRF